MSRSEAEVKLNDLLSTDATHLLECRHCIGKNCKDYYMLCKPLKTMPDGRLKLVVFGERHWKNKEHIKSIRYVAAHRVHSR
jgi:hypothetical protein